MNQSEKIVSSDGHAMLSSRCAAQRLDIASDYVTKLCREGKLKGVRMKNGWYVEEDSITKFEEERVKARILRSEELSEIRRLETLRFQKSIQLSEKKSAPPAPSAPSAQSTSIGLRGFLQTTPILALASVLFFGAVAYGAGSTLSHMVVSPNKQSAAVVTQVQSPFFSQPSGFSFPTIGTFIAGLFETNTPKTAVVPTQPTPVTQTSTPVTTPPSLPQSTHTLGNSNSSQNQYTPSQTIVSNTYPVIERVVVQNAPNSGDYVTLGMLNQQIAALRNYFPATVGYYEGPSNYSQLDTLTVNTLTVHNVSGGINLASGCFSINGVCITGGSATPAGSTGQVQFNTAGALDATSTLFYDSLTGRLGIGTSTPQSTLSLGAGGVLRITSNDGLSNGCFAQIAGQIQYSNDCTTFQSFTASSGGGWTDSGTTVHLTTNSENAAIGTSTSYAKLTIWGTSTNDSDFAFQVVNSASTTLFSISNAGVARLLNLVVANATTTNFFATTASTTNLFASNLTLGSMNGFLKATGGIVSSSLVNLGSDVFGILPVANGGTGSSTLIGLLKGNGTGPLLSAIAGVDYENPLTFTGPLSRSTNTISLSQANGSTAGYVSASDWNLFNGKISSSSLSGGVGISYNVSTGVITNTIGYAFPGNATSTALTFNGGLAVNGTTTLVGSTTISGSLTLTGATTTASNGINIASGCFAVAGVCVGSTSTTSSGTVALGPLGQQISSSSILFATSTTGSDFTITGSGSTITFNLPSASATNRGALTSTDWNTFNSKISSSSLSATGPLAYNSATGVFSITQANTSTNGYLSSSDFTIFNSKISSTSLSSANNYLTYNASTGVFTATTSPTYVNATTTNFAVTSLASTLLKTNALGQLVAAVSGTDYQQAGNYATFAYPFVNNATSTTLTFNGGLLSVGSTTVNGTLNATTLNLTNALSIANGGTGTSTAPTYGQLLLGDGTGAYALTSTSSLGIINYATSTDFTSIATWGDSITGGTGGNAGIISTYVTYPSYLSQLTGDYVYNGGLPGDLSSGIASRMLSMPSKYAWPTIILSGYNDIYASSTISNATIEANIASMVAALTTSNYLVLSVTNSLGSGTGDSRYTSVISLNNDLAATYGSHYLDIRSYLVSQYDPGQPQDVLRPCKRHPTDITPRRLCTL